MPTTKSIEDKLRQLGWFPSASQPSLVARRWVHSSDFELVIWVQRGRWLPNSVALEILAQARISK